MLGKLHGYYPEDPIQAWRVDSILDANRDIQEKYWDVQFASYKGLDKEATQKLLDKYISKILPGFLEVMQKRVAKNGDSKLMVGESITLADIDSAHVAFTYLLNETNEYYKEQSAVLEQFPQLKAYYQNLHDNVFKEYFENRVSGKPY